MRWNWSPEHKLIIYSKLGIRERDEIVFVVLRKFIDPCEPTEEYAHVEQFGVQKSTFCQLTVLVKINENL